jgi:hypothetical protein
MKWTSVSMLLSAEMLAFRCGLHSLEDIHLEAFMRHDCRA